MIEVINTWVLETFGKTGQTALVVIVSIFFASTVLPSLVAMINSISPQARRRRQRIEDVEVALKLVQLEKSQAESGLELIDTRSEWRHLVRANNRIFAGSQRSASLAVTPSKSAAEVEGDIGEHSMNTPTKVQEKSLLLIDPLAMSGRQKLLLAVPTYIVTLPIAVVIIIFAVGLFSTANPEHFPWYGWVYLVISGIMAFSGPMAALDELSTSDLDAHLNPLRYFVFLLKYVLALQFGLFIIVGIIAVLILLF